MKIGAGMTAFYGTAIYGLSVPILLRNYLLIIIVWTLKIKSLLPSLYKGRNYPFGKEGSGEIF